MHIALFLTFLYTVYASQCGDGICDTNESCTSCPSDCHVFCASNINPLAYCYGCQSTNDAYCYVYDVGSCVAPPPIEQCGDGICGTDEDCYSCNLDCGSCVVNALVWEYCGDFVCNNGETCETCSNDCVCSLENSTAIEVAGNNLAANTNANAESMPMLIGSITSGLLLMIIAGVGIGVLVYKANKKKRLAKEKEQEKGKVASTEHIALPNSMLNPILKTHSIQRNPVLSNSFSPPVRVPHKKSFAPQLASPTPDSMHSVPNSIASDVMKKTQNAFLEQYDLSSFNAIHARQNMRKVRRPIPSSGARLAEQINSLST